jgi:cytochrome c oxidase subunit 3
MSDHVEAETQVSEKDYLESFPVSFRKLGFWVFLSGEIIILGGIVAAGILFRLSYPEWFENSKYTNTIIGTLNTFVLLTGSLTVVLAHKYAAIKNWGKVNLFLGLTVLSGLLFLTFKYIEYSGEISHGFVPTKNVFWMFYFGITGLHGLHVLVGTLIIVGVMIFLRKKKVQEAVENAGLYWHFVDIVWLFIWPLFYLT